MPNQLSLFEPQAAALRGYQSALELLDPELAAQRRAELKSLHPHCRLVWEDQFHRLLPDLVAEPMDAEPAISRWTAFTRLPLIEQLGPTRLNRLQNRFFSLLLKRNALPTTRPRTPEGRSVGWLCWKAGRPEEAKKLLVREIQRFGDNPRTRVWLANCHFELGDPHAARVNYSEAFICATSEIDLDEIADQELAKFLRPARRELGEWSSIEACIDGVLPLPKMASRDQLDQYLNRFPAPESPAATELPTRNFYRCLIISLNRHLVDSATLLESRLTMKSLHPRLHTRHLQLLERQ